MCRWACVWADGARLLLLLLLQLLLNVGDGKINTTSDFNKWAMNAAEPSFNFIWLLLVGCVAHIGWTGPLAALWRCVLFGDSWVGLVDGDGGAGDNSVALIVSARFFLPFECVRVSEWMSECEVCVCVANGSWVSVSNAHVAYVCQFGFRHREYWLRYEHYCSAHTAGGRKHDCEKQINGRKIYSCLTILCVTNVFYFISKTTDQSRSKMSSEK